MSDKIVEDLYLPSIPESFKNPRTAEQIYKMRVLGRTEIPALPELMPEEIYLSPENLGSMETAIIETDADPKKRERLQDVWFKNGKHFSGPVCVGFKNFAPLLGFGIDIAKSASLLIKPLLTYHTHSEGVYFFSDYDIGGAVANHHEGYIFAVGAENGVVALCETKKSLKRSFDIPIVSFFVNVYKMTKIEKYLEEKGFTHYMDRLDQVAGFVDPLGFALYSWKPPEMFIEKGDMKNGIKLTRIHPSVQKPASSM